MPETAINDSPRRTTIATAQMVQDYRLVRLFAHVGKLINAESEDDWITAGDTLQALTDDLLALAPEYLPPFTDDEHDPDDWARWRELIEGADGA